MRISDWSSDVCSSDLKIQALCTRHGITGGQLALAWLLHRDQPIVPIPGTKRITYLEENVGAVDVTLSVEELAEVDALLPVGIAAGSAYDPNYADRKSTRMNSSH